MTEKRKDDVTGVETTGHNWDGIEELNNPLPRWWLWTFYITILWGVIYTIAYPAWPLVDRATSGVLGWSTREQVAEQIAEADAANAGMREALVAADLTQVRGNAELQGFAANAGAAVFRTYCSQCHGSGAAGAKGYPNLLDNDWLWGGTVDDILTTLRHGIRSDDDGDTRWSEMPAFGDLLSETEIATLVGHVQSMAQGGDPAAGEGGVLFADNCAACHGDTGEGDRTLGAPNLVDSIWLYGDDTETLTQTISEARFGVMPSWGGRLDESEIRAVAVYVHQLGGGETEQ